MPVRVCFIFPRWVKLLESHPELKDDVSGYEIGSFRMASLGIPTAAACLPPEVEILFQDQNLGEIDYSVDADLIALGFFTPQATNANEIADRFRALGKKTIAGGIHPTNATEDTLRHFDSVVVGEVEGLWEEILGDLASGSLKRTYKNEKPSHDLAIRQPVRSLFDGSAYLKTSVVQIARGCHFKCPFCVVPGTYGGRLKFRPIPDVVEDIRNLPHASYYIADENLLFDDAADISYADELMVEIAKVGGDKVFYAAAYPRMLGSLDGDRKKLFFAAGCRQIYLIFGMHRPICEELAEEETAARVRDFSDSGIELMASFTLGNDGDDRSCVETILSYCKENRLNLVEFTISVPFPGTPMFDRMKAEGRILTEEWGRYNAANVVFRPKNFTPDELLDFYLEMWKSFYRGISPFEMRKRYVKAFSGKILTPKNP